MSQSPLITFYHRAAMAEAAAKAPVTTVTTLQKSTTTPASSPSSFKIPKKSRSSSTSSSSNSNIKRTEPSLPKVKVIEDTAAAANAPGINKENRPAIKLKISLKRSASEVVDTTTTEVKKPRKETSKLSFVDMNIELARKSSESEPENLKALMPPPPIPPPSKKSTKSTHSKVTKASSSTISPAPTPTWRPATLSEAHAFIALVRGTFADKPLLYNVFLHILRSLAIKPGPITKAAIEVTRQKLQNHFAAYPELVAAFETIVPSNGR